jgi:general secretion pathway protein B
MCVVLLAAVAWLWLGSESRPEPRVALAPMPVTGAVSPPPTAPTAPPPPPGDLGAPPGAQGSPPPPPPAVAGAAPAVPAAPVSAPGPSTPPSGAKPAGTPNAPAVKPAPRPAAAQGAAASAPSKPPAPAAVAELRAPPLSALPENLRRELPTLVVGGSVYAKTPANRLLILNGQPFHEGDSPMSELVIEQIKLKSAVLSYKGQRFELSY